MRSVLLALALVAQTVSAHAQSVRQVRRGEPAAADPSKAYLLFREDPRQGPGEFDFVLAREVPERAPPARLALPPRFDAQASLIRTDSRFPYADDGGRKTYLLAVPPGRYVIVAVTYKRMPTIGTCLCMGTVRFDARGGAVNDLGFLLGAIEDKPSAIPELAPLVGAKHWTHTAPALALMAVRPATDVMEVPAALRSIPLVRAEYRAAGKFPNYFRTMINRVPAIAGVLAYEGDQALDDRFPGK